MGALKTIGSITLNLAICADQALNCLWHVDGDGWGKPDEMVSARAARLVLIDHPTGPIAMRRINRLFFWQRDENGNLNHCWRAWRTEAQREQLPSHYQPTKGTSCELCTD